MLKRIALFSLLAGLMATSARSEKPPLLSDSIARALAEELSGESAKRNLEFLTRQHRMRGSQGYHAAATHLAQQLRAHGLQEVRIERFPADGEIFYGTQKSRPPWDAEFAELWELEKGAKGWEPKLRLASWEAMPISLAQDSESAEVTADLVDVGAGTSAEDYAGKEIKGNIVLTSSQPGAVTQPAVVQRGAVGMVSYAQNQRTAWWGENENLVRWGHLESYSRHPTFAFMVSLKQARKFQERLARGERVRLRAVVRAGKHPGAYEVVTATIPGADDKLRSEEIAFSCHLDHQRPGANDNASGAAAILEVARSLAKLIQEKKISRPARTLRFIWPPEFEGTLALLASRPELTSQIKAVIHLDMVGGSPETKAVFHVTRGPATLPSFIYDVAEALGAFVNRETAAHASGRQADYPLTAPEGEKEALQAELAEFSMGSDHMVYTDSSFGIPAIYLNDWPDRYIHTNHDSAANIDPTKLKRAAFIAAAAGYFLADAASDDAPSLWRVCKSRSLQRLAVTLRRQSGLSAVESAGLARFHVDYEEQVIRSFGTFLELPPDLQAEASAHLADLERLLGDTGEAPFARDEGRRIFVRNPEVRGPMTVMAYDYLEDHYGKERMESIRLLKFEEGRDSGGAYAYEVLNLVDGRRTAQEIQEAVSAIYGPVPLGLVLEYLKALEEIEVIRPVNSRRTDREEAGGKSSGSF